MKEPESKDGSREAVPSASTAGPSAPKRYANFSDVVGQWVDDPEFDEIMASQRQIDWDLWK